MDVVQKLVISIPLQELWNEKHPLGIQRIATITATDLKQLLRTTSVRFVVADVGHKLRWIDLQHCFLFWKNEVQPYLVEQNATLAPHDYPSGYAYQASQWTSDDVPVILLEKLH